jgi:hypothetical protein
MNTTAMLILGDLERELRGIGAGGGGGRKGSRGGRRGWGFREGRH